MNEIKIELGINQVGQIRVAGYISKRKFQDKTEGWIFLPTWTYQNQQLETNIWYGVFKSEQECVEELILFRANEILNQRKQKGEMN